MKDTERVISVIGVGVRTIVIVGLFICTVFTTSAESETVTFEGKTATEKAMKLTGILMKPDGDGPFPAVVLLHGCSGMYSKYSSNLYNTWASRLVNWGYVTLQVDSLGPRDKTNICARTTSVHPYERMYDAYAGKSYLVSHSYVDNKRIVVMGWSHGGSTTLYTVDNERLDRIRSDPFKAAIAFYPHCGDQSLLHLNTPLLILIGGEDDWTRAPLCKNMRLEPKTSYEVTLKVYPGAHHGFDFEGVDIEVEGHQVRYDPIATKDAIVQVKNFLAKHL